MAKTKPTYHKLGLKPNIHINELEYNDQIIKVKDYLPIQEKLDMIADIILESKDDQNPFINIGKVSIILYLHILYHYTDLAFTDKQKEDLGKLYDSIMTTGFMTEVLKLIPQNEIEFLKYLLDNQIQEMYKYQNSIRGILQDIMTDYSDLDIEATDIQKKLQDPNNLTLLRSVMKELG